MKYQIVKVSHNNSDDKTILHKGIIGLEKAEKLLEKTLSNSPEHEKMTYGFYVDLDNEDK